MSRGVALALLIACNSPPEPTTTGSGSGSASPPPTSTPEKLAPKKTQPITSPLPERGPHPDYPTPVAAGTDKLFVLEEPDRGPLAPLDAPIPNVASWTSHAHCELDVATVICTPSRGSSLVHWRVGREGTLTVAQRRRGNAAVATYVFVRADSAPKRRITYDEYDRVESALLFQSPTRYSMRMRSGANGLAGCGAMDVAFDKSGHTERVRCLQWSGDSMRATDGVAERRYKRDTRGMIAEELRLGLDGAPAVGTDNVHRIVYERDGDGRIVAERFFGIDDHPTASTRGCHGYRTEYDNRGLVVVRGCIGADGKRSNDSRGVTAHETRYDDAGCRVAIRYTGIGKPPKDPDIDYVVDTRCAVISHTCIDVRGNRVACGPGEPARYDYKRDAAGRAISTSSYKPDGTADLDPVWRGFEIRRDFDHRGLAITLACFDRGGVAVDCKDLGYHKMVSTWDDAGRELARRFYAPDGRAATNTGASIRKFIYDNYDHQFEGRGYDLDGKVIETNGMAVRRDLYDVAHRRFGVILLDKAGKPAHYSGCYSSATCPKVWHAVRIVRRADGSVAKNQFFDATGQLIETKDCTKVRCFR